MEPTSYSSAGGVTTVPLKLDPSGTVFVVFRGAAQPSRQLPDRAETKLGGVDGPWNIHFEETKGAPLQVKLDHLASWSESTDPGVRYFSGHATYTHHLDAPAAWFTPRATVSIDLGKVANLAEVTLNGKPLGVAWKAPYRVDATAALHPRR